MSMRRTAWRKATSGSNTPLVSHRRHGSNLSSAASAPAVNSGRTAVTSADTYASISSSQKLKQDLDRDFLLSVLETSVTRRDARAYMNKFVPLLERKGATDFRQRAVQSRASSNSNTAPASLESKDSTALSRPSHSPKPGGDLAAQEPLYVALVKFRAPELVDDLTLDGVGRTLSQLRRLGLISIVVVDCEADRRDAVTQRHIATTQANRIVTVIDKYVAIDESSGSGARVIDSPITITDSENATASPFTSQTLFVSNPTDLMNALQNELIPIIPSFGYTENTCTVKPVNANDAVLALTRQLSGLQFPGQLADDTHLTRLLRAAEIYRLVVLDPLGGIPAKNRATGRHLFLNLEQEYPEVKSDLEGSPATTSDENTHEDNAHHLANAELARSALALLPPTSSAVITTPWEVARERLTEENQMDLALVGTRRGQNPLIHSLLTDKPVQSPSLPTERFMPITSWAGTCQIGALTTLAKRGMPLTVFPNPRVTPWTPPQPGQERLRLTDPCIDLARLVTLIEDSFGRKLDVDDYLKRIEGSLAGIIIAGEYEGGAIFTWEKPSSLVGMENPDPSRLVPYLDKFAVLRKSQGGGGVADIVFNAMVRDCFPQGVCWRSRKDNPVNKWYFERSRGSLKFRDMNWTMFWTTPDLLLEDERFQDYKSVCRGIEPSWADKKHILD
ncbi:N-acetylglutamate synthase [Xylariaceae sp. FL0804]|nr:N-acetylglutamate synthase [Xylariaceae sp. FL0804]